jgi:hypothetical protein
MVVITTTSVTVPRYLIVVVLVLVLLGVDVVVGVGVGVVDRRVLGAGVATFGVDIRHGGNFQNDVVVAVIWPRLPGPG